MDNLENRMKLGNRIKELRNEQGLSLRRFGMMTGLGHTYLCELESDKRQVRFDTICKITDNFGISLHDFFNWD